MNPSGLHQLDLKLDATVTGYWVGGRGGVDPSDPFLLWDAISRMPPLWVTGFFQKRKVVLVEYDSEKTLQSE